LWIDIRAVTLPPLLRRSLIVALVAVACTSAPITTETSSTPSSASTTQRVVETTTTAAPYVFELSGGPEELAELVEGVYAAACGVGELPASVPSQLGDNLHAKGQCINAGTAAVGSFGGAAVAVVQAGDDAFYATSRGDGWQLAAARLPSLGLEGWYGTTPKLVAVLGSDARDGQDPGFTRADSIHLIGLDGGGGGAVIGIPRDSWVGIAGHGSNKINAALSLGGPPLMMQTLKTLTGLPFAGYTLTGFTGFQEMWGNVLGGADVDVPLNLNDRASGANLGAGTQYLNGPQALALARTRKTIAGGDFTRSEHGGLLLLAALAGAKLKGVLSIPALLEGSTPWLLTDLSAEELLAFTALAMDTPLPEIKNIVAPGFVGQVGQASVVFLADNAPTVFADLADGRLTP
jgi:LCP family protein required for cell wall assembly